ncbi:MAG: hypothetical protein LBM18_05675 [Oscillospiraceae bacterium]|nr:hypothetical protein [Oscillospiraceae bacterium]
MAYSMDTVLSEILDNPEAFAVMDELIPEAGKNPMIKLVRSFTLGRIALIPAANVSPEKMQEFIDALNAKLG